MPEAPQPPNSPTLSSERPTPEQVRSTRPTDSEFTGGAIPRDGSKISDRNSSIGHHNRPKRFNLRVSGVEPALRLTALALRLILRHGWGGLADRFSPQTREARRSARTSASARDAARTLGLLKGAFAKAGQFASTRHDVLLALATAALGDLRDRCPPIPMRDVRAVIEAELGAPLEAHFVEFDAEPVGSASIAQVHRARTTEGAEVAVKVQYPWLRASLGRDLRLLRFVAARFFASRGHGGEQFDRLFAEFSEGIADELDFRVEARVAGEIAAHLADDPGIVVPRVHGSRSRARVLTLDYYAGISLGDRAALTAAGVSPAAVLEILARAYAKQVFVDGLFHADPHPGNLFALPDPDDPAGVRVLFVDFGLSKRLSPELRHEMRNAIFAVLQRDPDAFVSRMQTMNMITAGAEEEVRIAVGAMFEEIGGDADQTSILARSGDQVLHLKDQAKTLLQDTPGIQLPNDLLLYAKTLSYLFHLGDELDPDVDLMKLTVPYLLKFLASRD